MKRWSKFSILVFCAAFLTQFSLQGQSVQIHSHNDYQKITSILPGLFATG